MNGSAPKPRVTFVLPGRIRSGGVCVTARMGEELRRRGWPVRIAWRDYPFLDARSYRWNPVRLARRFLNPAHETDGLAAFHGPLARYERLGEVAFDAGEIAVAVGSMTVPDVRALAPGVHKVRYCHGLTTYDDQLTRSAWEFNMPTIAVAPTLAAALEAMSGEPLLGVVPNGIDLDDYHEEPGLRRDGIGFIYGNHVSKNPELIRQVSAALRRRWPALPLYAFGAEPRPRGLTVDRYHHFPTVDEARRLYNRSLIWLVLSRSEGFSLPILEAMACGAAVVSTPTDGARYLLDDGRNGLLAPGEEPESLLKRIEWLLNHEAQRRRMVEEGHRTARMYSWEAAVIQLEDCLEKLIASPAAHQSPDSPQAAPQARLSA